MELRHLRYFVGVAEEENVSRAARKLNVSQPALSRQIRDLEDEIGFLLLDRGARAVRLTEAGRVFLVEARNVLTNAESAVKAARAVATGERGELNVGYAPSPTSRLLPPTLRAFQAAMPGVRVKLHDLSSGQMLAGLREGKLQLAALVRPPAGRLRGFHFEELARDSICLAVAPDHPLARRRSVTLAEVAREPLITYSRQDHPEIHESLAALFNGINRKPSIAEEHDSVHGLIAGVESGAGVALALRSLACTAGPRLKLVPFSPELVSLAIGLAWTDAGFTPAAERFLQCARERLEKPERGRNRVRG